MATGFVQRWKGKVAGALGFIGNLTVQNSLTLSPQIVAAAGTNSQTNSTVLSATGGAAVIVTTVSASSRGVRLPTAVAGLRYELFNQGGHIVQVFPATADKIGTASTNASVNVTNNKGAIFLAKDATNWALIVGA